MKLLNTTLLLVDLAAGIVFIAILSLAIDIERAAQIVAPRRPTPPWSSAPPS